MTCQSSGRSPTIAMGLGPVVTPSRIRIPRPPQNSTTFTGSTPYSDNFKCRDREHQPAPPGPDVVKLRGDLVPEVPGQDKDVVGLGFRQPFGSVDRDMRTREELS